MNMVAERRRQRARKLYAEGAYTHRQIAKIMKLSPGAIHYYLGGIKRCQAVEGLSFNTPRLHAMAWWLPNRNPRASWHAPR